MLPDSQNYTPVSLLRSYIEPAIESEGALPPNSKTNARLDNILKSIQMAPKPVPVTDFPDTARSVSGRKWQVESNPYGIGDSVLIFSEGEDEAHFEWENAGVKYSGKVGLDDAYRFTDMRRFSEGLESKMALKGVWSAEDTFTIYYHNVGFTSKGRSQVTFDGDLFNALTDDIVWGPMQTKGRLEKSSD